MGKVARRWAAKFGDCVMAAKRTDANQAEIVRALRDVGARVHSTHMVAGGFPDLVVGFGGRVVLLEVKDGSKKPSAQKLTPDEIAWHQLWDGYAVVVNSIDQALLAIGIEV